MGAIPNLSAELWGPRDPSAVCFPVTKGEAISEPNGGWESPVIGWFQLLQPFGPITEPASCVTDDRPALASSCEPGEETGTGSQAAEEPEPILKNVVIEEHLPHVYRRWTYDERGFIAEFIDEQLTDSHWRKAGDVMHWRLQFACDGRPSHYEGAPEWLDARFIYDSLGRMLQRVRPFRSERESYWPDGRLRARSTMTWRDHKSPTRSDTVTTSSYFDKQGRLLASRYLDDDLLRRVTRSVHIRYDAHGPAYIEHGRSGGGGYAGGTRTRIQRDDLGRPVLEWTEIWEADLPYILSREVRRTTRSCGTGDPVTLERALGGEGYMGPVETTEWLWSEAEQVIREVGPDGTVAREYTFDCAP